MIKDNAVHRCFGHVIRRDWIEEGCNTETDRRKQKYRTAPTRFIDYISNATGFSIRQLVEAEEIAKIIGM